MARTDCREDRQGMAQGNDVEVVRIERAQGSCGLCEDYAEQHKSKTIAVMSCDGACLRGELSRQAANILCHTLLPEKTVRICLGGAFTKNTGQRGLVRNASRLLSLEGCPVQCAARMMRGVIEGLTPDIVRVDRLCTFDQELFGIDEMSPEAIHATARVAAEKIVSTLI